MTKNKFVASLVAMTILATSCLTGCGSNQASTASSNSESNQASQGESGQSGTELEPVEITWLLRIQEQPDGKEVLDKVNERFKEEINATLNIQFIDAAAYAEKTKLKISAGEAFDIMFTSAGYGFFDYASKKAFLPLDDLLTQYAPKTYAQIPEDFWGATTVKGEIYGIPNYQIAARQSTLDIRTEMVEKYNIDTSKLKTLEDMEPVLKMLKEGEPNTNFVFNPPVLTYFDTMNYMGLECIGADGTPGAIEINGTDLKVLNQFEHPAFVQLVNTAKKYEQAGYINKDQALLADILELQKNGEFLAAAIGNYKPGIEAENHARYGYESEFIKITEPYVNTTSILGTLQAISRTSKNPERAMMLLELVNTDPDIYNTIVYGLEGKHYTKTGDNTIDKIPDSGYDTNVPWMIGNTFNGYLITGSDPAIYTQTQELNKNSKISRIMGFSFDAEAVKAEISQCAAVLEKYQKGFQFGMFDDVEASLKQFNDELRTAGMDKIIAEKQTQLDAWAAAK